MENMDKINNKRLEIWKKYNEFLKQFDDKIRRPIIPDVCKHNAHMYYLLFNNFNMRTKFIDFMKKNDILTVFHYIPLHSSPAGQKYCRALGDMSVTDNVSDTLVRLPVFYELDDNKINYILEKIKLFMKRYFD